MEEIRKLWWLSVSAEKMDGRVFPESDIWIGARDESECKRLLLAYAHEFRFRAFRVIQENLLESFSEGFAHEAPQLNHSSAKEIQDAVNLVIEEGGIVGHFGPSTRSGLLPYRSY